MHYSGGLIFHRIAHLPGFKRSQNRTCARRLHESDLWSNNPTKYLAANHDQSVNKNADDSPVSLTHVLPQAVPDIRSSWPRHSRVAQALPTSQNRCGCHYRVDPKLACLGDPGNRIASGTCSAATGKVTCWSMRVSWHVLRARSSCGATHGALKDGCFLSSHWLLIVTRKTSFP